MPIPSSAWDSRHETSYPSEFRTRYRSLGDAIYDDYDNRDANNLKPDYKDKNLFQGIAVAAEGYIAWLTNNLTGGSAPLGGGSFEDPYSFNFSDADRASFLRALGCRADRESMCYSYSGRYTSGELTVAVKHTIFGLSLCNEDVRNQLGNREPFEFDPTGSMCLYDRYNFTDLQDFSRAPGGNILEAGVKVLAANLFGQATGGLVGILNNSGIPDAVNSWFNGVSESPDYEASPYFEWRADGATFEIQEIRRVNGTVYVTTKNPHGLNNTDGAGIKIVDSSSNNDSFDIPDDNQGGWPNGVDINVTGSDTFAYFDPSTGRPDRTETNPSNISAVQKKRWGKGRHMYTKDCFSATDMRTHNPELYFDAVGRGLIPYDAIPGVIEVGDKQPNPIVAGIAGLTPTAPISVELDPSNPNSFGFSQGSYSAPFNSWSQNIVNATYDLGPYAKVNKFVFQLATGLSLCDDPEDWQEKNKGEYGLYGRLIIIPSGLYAGELGFILQNWYNFDDTPYNTNNGQAPPQGTPFPSKQSWWRSTIKSTTTAHFMHLSDRPLVKVQVAYNGPQFGSLSYYAGTDLGNTTDYTVELITVLVAAAAISGIAF